MKQLVETKKAFLPSEGYNKRVATEHVYHHSEVITKPARSKEEEPQTGLAHFYRCTETDAIRQWGFDRFNTRYNDVGN